MALTTVQIRAGILATLTHVMGTAKFDVNSQLQGNAELAAGLLALEVDRIIQGGLVIPNAATPQTINLNNAAAIDPVGDPAQMVEVCAILAINRSTELTAIVEVGGGATPFVAWNKDASDIRLLMPKNGFDFALNLLDPSWACAAGANNLKFTAQAGTNVPIDYAILGRSA